MNILKLLTGRRDKKNTAPVASDRVEIMVSGLGGQGIILSGKILAEAASIFDGKEAVMSQSYGPEARGGASRAEIIISSGKIYYPKVIQVNIFVTMSQQSLDKYGDLLNAEGLMIADETYVKNIPARFKNVFKAPFSSVAMNLLENPLVANIIALGALVAITHVVTRESLIHAVLERVSQKVLVSDRVAVDTGFKLVEDSGFTWKMP